MEDGGALQSLEKRRMIGGGGGIYVVDSGK
jgi:hypothetical protein